MNKITIGNCTLYHGDCLEMLNEISDESIDLALVDPPYGIGYVANHRKILPIAEMLTNDDAPRLDFVPPIVKTVRKGGAIYLCTRFDVMPLWCNALKNAGAKVKVPIIWDKMMHTQGDITGDYGNRIEIILVAHIGRHTLRNGRSDNLWSILRPKIFDHPTPKPVELFRRCIIHSSDPGDLILDPCFGSGTSAVACLLTGRKFIGCEIDEQFFEMSCERIEQTYQEIKNRLPGFESASPEQMLLFQ